MSSSTQLLTVLVLTISLFLLARNSFKNMNRESEIVSDGPSVWTHLFILELVLTVYVGLNLIHGGLRILLQW